MALILNFQHCIAHGVTIALIVTGSACLLSDAFGTRVQWIHQMIIDLMDPANNYNNYYKDVFLGTMAKTVGLKFFLRRSLKLFI